MVCQLLADIRRLTRSGALKVKRPSFDSIADNVNSKAPAFLGQRPSIQPHRAIRGLEEKSEAPIAELRCSLSKTEMNTNGFAISWESRYWPAFGSEISDLPPKFGFMFGFGL
jgi:hypothetical protein